MFMRRSAPQPLRTTTGKGGMKKARIPRRIVPCVIWLDGAVLQDCEWEVNVPASWSGCVEGSNVKV